MSLKRDIPFFVCRHHRDINPYPPDPLIPASGERGRNAETHAVLSLSPLAGRDLERG